jgi:glucosamine--fructose-6-phosphate aminotransferase (isomerizing)
LTKRAKPKAEFGEIIPVTIGDMLAEIEGQSRAVPAVIESIMPQLEALDPSIFTEAEHTYITGCGDSFMAGLAARYAFESLARLPTEPHPALELGRYTAEFLPPKSLVFSISNSGKATRTVEAAINARIAGAMTIAITGNVDSWLAQESELALDQSVRIDGQLMSMPSNMMSDAPEEGSRRGSFGLANYLASLTTLYCIAIHAGRVRGRLSASAAESQLRELERMSEAIDETVLLCSEPAQAYAKEVSDRDNFIILGAGPSYATSVFSAAKTYELSRVNGVAQELEEWAHLQYFITKPGSQVLFVAPPGRSTGRTLELAYSAKLMGATCVAITDESVEELDHSFAKRLPVAGNVPEIFSPLVYCVPGELFATYLAKEKGLKAFEFDSRLQYETNMRTIQESELFDFTEYHE